MILATYLVAGLPAARAARRRAAAPVTGAADLDQVAA